MTYRYVNMATLRWVQLFVLVAALVQGGDIQLDMLIIDKYKALVSDWMVAVMLSAGPSWIWSGLFVLGGLLGLAGEAWMQWGKAPNRWILSWSGHTLLSCLYLLLCLISLVSAIAIGAGFAQVAQLLGFSLINFVLGGMAGRDSFPQ